MKRKILFLLFFVFCICRCAQKDAPIYKMEIIDGITVVQNLKIDQKRSFRDLSFSVDLAIGVEEGEADYMLYSPVDIDADKEGNIYILDLKDAQVKKYDHDGLFVGNIGRKGQGPGEFNRPNLLEIDSFNQILVSDPYQRRFIFMERDGNYIKSLRMGPYVSSLVCGKDGSILIGYGWNDSDGNQEYRIGFLDRDTGEVMDLFSQKRYWPARLTNDRLQYDFPYFVRTAVDSQNRIILGVATDYKIQIVNPKGESELEFTQVHDKIPVKGEMLNQITDITLKGPNPYIKNPFFPVFESLSVDEDGDIWIQHYQPKWVGKINEETGYDVFNSEGIFQFTTKIPGHIRSPLIFKNGFIYALRLNEAGFMEALRLNYKK